MYDTEVFNDIVGVVGGKAVEVAPVMNEVAVAAVDSCFPVATLQYLVGYVHCYTGCNWWASIAVATLLLRFIQLPFSIHQLKFISNISKSYTDSLILELRAILKGDDDLTNIKKALALMKIFYKKYGETAALGLIMSDVTLLMFFFAISNMAEKVPSFITGGTLWFTDLTTPDSMRLPVLLALTVFIRFELKHHNKYRSMFYGALALLGTTTLGFPKAIYCYWITSSLFSIAYSSVVMEPHVQKLLGISTDKKSR